MFKFSFIVICRDLNGEEIARKGRRRGRDRESFDSIPPLNSINITPHKVNLREYDGDTYVEYFHKETAIEDISRNFNDYGFGMFLITEMLLKSASTTDPDDSQHDNETLKSPQECRIINSVEEKTHNAANSFKQKSVFNNFSSTEKNHFSNLLKEISRNMKNEEIHRAFKYVTVLCLFLLLFNDSLVCFCVYSLLLVIMEFYTW